MINYSSIFLVAVALSMDAFSIAITIGINNISYKRKIMFILGVGLCHYLLPWLGMKLGQTFFVTFILNSTKILGIILLFLAAQMVYERFFESDKEIKTSFFSLLLLIISVSLDSFMTGIGLYEFLGSHLILITFSATSMLFSFLGIVLGKLFNKIIGKYSELIGIAILMLVGVKFLFS